MGCVWGGWVSEGVGSDGGVMGCGAAWCWDAVVLSVLKAGS